MSNDSTPPAAADQPKPGLPQFDPNAPAGHPAAGDTEHLPSVGSTSELPVTPPSAPYAYAVSPGGSAPIAGPDVPLSPTGLPVREKSAAAGTGDGPRWSAKKTAVTAGLALVLASAGAIGAAAALPAGSAGGDTGFRGPGGGRAFRFPGGQQGLQNPNQQNQGQQGAGPQQLPNLQNGSPGGLNGIDPNQLSQLDPQDLLQQLNQLGQGSDPFSDDQGQDPGPDDSGSGTTGTTKTT